jgi:dolichol kinase
MNLWTKTKKWADENRTVSGALAGFAAGTVVPGVGNVLGAVVGAGIGYASSKEKKAPEAANVPDVDRA